MPFSLSQARLLGAVLLALVLAFPATAQPSALSQEAKLTASDAAQGDSFGGSVSLSGNRALVGASSEDCAGDFSTCGAAYIFDFDGTAWAETAKLTASDADAGDQFGISVSLDGDRALIGANSNDDAGQGSGAAYIFEFDGTAWTETAKLTASDAAPFVNFGLSVSLSGDGALIGAPFDVTGGAAYVFELDGAQPPGSQWTETAKLTASDAAQGDLFGRSVSLSGDRALVGASSNDEAGLGSGAAYVFEFDGSAWTETAKLTASDAAPFVEFGREVSLDGDGALVGSPFDNDRGAAYVFAFDGTAWTETAKLTASDGAEDDAFGGAVALSGDGALIGARSDEDFTGAAYVFEFGGTGWTETAKLTASDAAQGDEFAGSVSLDGDRALAGSSGVDDVGQNSGAAYVFDLSPPVDLRAEATSPTTVAPGDSVTFAYSITNSTPTDLQGDLWYTVAEPAFSRPIASGTIASGQTLEGSYTQHVPVVAAPGDYTYLLRVGLFTNLVADEEAFTLTVTGSGGRVVDGGEAWTLSGVAPWMAVPKATPSPEAASRGDALPSAFALEAAYPNPFAARATVGFAVPEAAHVTLRVYDMLGRTVAALVDGEVEPGRHEAVLDGRGLSSGTYLVRLEAGGAVQTQRLTLVR